MLLQEIEKLLGVAPEGYEALWYVFAFVVLYFLLSTTFAVIWSVVSWIGGR